MIDPIPGRLQHTRCYTSKGTLDIVNAYQFPQGVTKLRPFPQASRNKFWQQLEQLLRSLPFYNILLIGGDMHHFEVDKSDSR